MEELFALLKERNLQIISYHQGHRILRGKFAHDELNPYCLVRDDREPFEKVFYAMLCKPKGLIYISIYDLEKILFSENGKRETWQFNKYRNCITNLIRNGIKQKVLHCQIKEHNRAYPLIHYNGNMYDNRLCNLRYFSYYYRFMADMPREFYSWYSKNRNKDDVELPQHCYYVVENKINKHYFIIGKRHPVLARKKITYEIASSKNGDGPVDLIEKYLQIEKALNFIAIKGTNWTFDEIIANMFT